MSKQCLSENTFSASLYKFDKEMEKGREIALIGIDEAGRGSLAGPVVAAAVCLDLDKLIEGVNDSKKLPADRRCELYEKIISEALCWSTGFASPEEIDKYNILQATFLAMSRAVEKLELKWDLALIDGNKSIPQIEKEKQISVVGGDAKSASIAAASILAKVTRDRIMEEYHGKYPVYDFLNNKGYATEYHRNSIMEHGLSEIHRRSFCDFFLQTSLPL